MKEVYEKVMKILNKHITIVDTNDINADWDIDDDGVMKLRKLLDKECD